MRKYIILFLLWGIFGNAQYNLFARQNFAYKTISAPTFNTYIGGVSGTITSASSLATKLGISVVNISDFTIVGSDIKCKITGTYEMPIGCWLNDIAISYYIDSDNLVTKLKTQAFRYTTAMKRFEFNGCTEIEAYQFENNAREFIFKECLIIGANAFRGASYAAAEKVYYIPKATILGASVGNDNVFDVNFGDIKVYTNPILATINAGGAEGDLVNNAQRSMTVAYVTNYTAPNPITDLSSGIVSKSSIQLNFTAPTGSTNAISYYDAYINGEYRQKITASGQYITGFLPNTMYSIELNPVDIFYNKSTSNIINVTTAVTDNYPTAGLISYWKMESSSIDSYGSNNGTDTAVTHALGKVNNTAVYDGSTSKTIIGNPANLQISQGTLSCWIKTSGAGSSYRSIFGKTDAYNMFLVDGVFGIYSWAGATGFKSTGVNLNDGLWHHIAFVFESGTSLNYLYVDGVLKLTTSMTISTQASNFCIGSSNSIQNFNGQIDEASVHNMKLTLSEIQFIYNSGIGITL